MQRGFLLIGLAGVTILFFFIARRFVMPAILAAISVGLFYPVHRRLVDRLGGRTSLASILSTIIVTLIIAAPAGGLIYLTVDNLIKIGTDLTRNAGSLRHIIGNAIDFLQNMPLFRQMDIRGAVNIDNIIRFAQQFGSRVVQWVRSVSADVAVILIQVFVYLYCLFFFFRDGEKLLKRLVSSIPVDPRHQRRILHTFVEVTSATIKSTFVIGLLQGGVGGLTLFILGARASVLWGVLLMFLAIIPQVGAILVWLPATVLFAIQGSIVKAVIMLAVGGGIIPLVDYILRPRIIGEEIRIHEVLVLFGVFGGIALFGVFGFIIGPVMMAVFVISWKQFGEIFSASEPQE